jgi:hypothetical protein
MIMAMSGPSGIRRPVKNSCPMKGPFSKIVLFYSCSFTQGSYSRTSHFLYSYHIFLRPVYSYILKKEAEYSSETLTRLYGLTLQKTLTFISMFPPRHYHFGGRMLMETLVESHYEFQASSTMCIVFRELSYSSLIVHQSYVHVSLLYIANFVYGMTLSHL